MVERALALGDAEGLEELTIRRLAQELGVTPMALYWHFRNKEELLAGLAEQVWSEIDTDIDPTAGWAQQLRGLLESLVQVLRRTRARPSCWWPVRSRASSAEGHRDHAGGAPPRRIRSQPRG